MPTLVDMAPDKSRLYVQVTERIVKLKGHDGKNIDANLYFMSDGLVYYYDGIYAFSDTKNKVKELIIVNSNGTGLYAIHTKEVSKTNRVLIKRIEEFLELLYEIIGTVTKDDMTNIINLPDRSIIELKEEILLKHAV